MIPTDDFLEFFVLVCSAVSKPIRLKVIHLIGKGKRNVGELQRELGISMSSLSNHLNGLYRAGILGKEKQGNFVYYYLICPGLLDGISGMEDIVKEIAGLRGKTGL